MNRSFFIILMALLLPAAFVSCSKPNDPPAIQLNRIQYNITGNFSGTLIASYTNATGGTTNETAAALPWKKEIEYAPGVTAAVIAVSGNGGIAGQEVTVVVIKKTATTSSTTTVVTADNSGSFSKAAPTVIF